MHKTSSRRAAELPGGVSDIPWLPGPGQFDLLQLLQHAGLAGATAVDKSQANELDAGTDGANTGTPASPYYIPHSIVVER